jgi:hypothetical protein
MNSQGVVMEHNLNQESAPKFWGSKYSIGYVVLGAIAAYFLFTEHYAHTIATLPFLLLLACPLMNMFMHHGHGDSGGKDTNADTKEVQ